MEFIKTLKKRLRLTNYALAKKLGVSPQSVDYLENKQKDATLTRICKLRRLSKMSWTEFGAMLDREFHDDSNSNT